MKIKSDHKTKNLVILVLFLLVTALSGFVPVVAAPDALPAAAPSAQDSVQITFGMDVHQNTDRFTEFLTCVANDGITPDVVAQGGDFNNNSTAGTAYNSAVIDPIITAIFPNAVKLYTQGNNDSFSLVGTGNFKETGVAYEGEDYIIYGINEYDFPLSNISSNNSGDTAKANAAAATISDLRNFLTAQKGAGKVIFILSHIPLHQSRNDNPYGYNMALMLNDVIDNDLDVVFLWGHNHTTDTSQTYRDRGSTVSFYNGSGGQNLVTEFIYAAAGYINGSSTNSSVVDSGTVATVSDTTITLTRYQRSNCSKTQTLTADRYTSQSTDLTGVSISGTPMVGRTLTSALIPGGASATYQWQSAATSGGAYANILGATGSTYILAAGDLGRHIRLQATGSGNTFTSNVLGPVTATTSTIYRLTNTLETGKKYLVVSRSSAGEGYVLAHNNSTASNSHVSVQVNVIADSGGNYIIDDATLAKGVWTATTSGSGVTLKNGSYYVEASGQNSAISMKTGATTGRYWLYADHADISGTAKNLYFGGSDAVHDHIVQFNTSNIFFSTWEDDYSGSDVFLFAEEEGAVSPTAITSVAITNIDAPVALVAPDTTASVPGSTYTAGSVSWTPSDNPFNYNTVYIASVTLTAAQGYAFTSTTSATVNGQTATSVTLNGDGTLTVTFTFPETGDSPSNTHAIDLKTGWNLVSFNLIPNDDKIEVILADIFDDVLLVYAWDATEAGSWMRYAPLAGFGNSLAALDNTMGFWINMKKDATLTVTGTQPTSTNIALYKGWNLIGYPVQNAVAIPDALIAIDEKYDLILAYKAFDTEDPWKLYDPDAPNYANDLATMAPGWGYWIHITETTAFDWSILY